MAAITHSRIDRQSAFTLIEVLFAISISAILMSAITLGISVQSGLIDASKAASPLTALSLRLDQIEKTQLLREIEELVGVNATANPLSDPSGTEEQILIRVEREQTGSNTTAAQVIAIKASSGSDSLTRWLTPTETP